MDRAPFLSGQLLLSMPGIGDPRFERVVIAMCLHDDDGALGLVVNSRMGALSVRGLMEQLDIDPGVTPADAMVMQGGPVEPGRGFVLHSAEYDGQSTISVSGARGTLWGLTSTLDVLKDIAAGKGPQRWLATLGYTGWGAGQLEGEMTRHGWMTAPGDTGLLFETPLAARWGTAFAGLGVAVERLSAASGQA
jgi:putative transcriptional regulator